MRTVNKLSTNYLYIFLHKNKNPRRLRICEGLRGAV